MNLDIVAQNHPDDILTPSTGRSLLPNFAWSSAAFVVFWELQSQVASLAYLALVAFFSIWIALGAMLAWSLLATVFFCSARERGYPNILSQHALPKERHGLKLAWYALSSIVRAWLAGISAFIFARLSTVLVTERKGCCKARKAVRFGVIVTGMTLFGVSSTEHLLRQAGYSGTGLTKVGLIGPFLNVPYRVLLSAAFIALVQDWIIVL